MEMRDWARIRYNTIVPDAIAAAIRRQYQSDYDQRRQGAQYYINIHPDASWGDLAGKLYHCEETIAMEAFKAQLPKPKGNQCDCVECVSAVCSDSVQSAL